MQNLEPLQVALNDTMKRSRHINTESKIHTQNPESNIHTPEMKPETSIHTLSSESEWNIYTQSKPSDCIRQKQCLNQTLKMESHKLYNCGPGFDWNDPRAKGGPNTTAAGFGLDSHPPGLGTQATGTHFVTVVSVGS